MQPSLRMTCTFALPILAVACALSACLAKNPPFADDVDGAFATGSSSGPSSSSGAATSSGSGSGGSSGTPSSSGTSSGQTSSGASSGSSGSSSGHIDSGTTSSSGSGLDAGCDPNGGQVPTNVKFDSSGYPTCQGTPPKGCNLKANVCCIDTAPFIPAYSCIANTQQCSPASSSARFGCVQKTDCPGDQICCLQADQTTMSADSLCMDAGPGGKCSPAVTATAGSAQLCQTSKECKSGGCCIWQDCNVMGNPLQLTLCGVQATSLFTCSAH